MADHVVLSPPLVQQHSLDQVVVYKYPSYQWDHACSNIYLQKGAKRRGERERKRARREVNNSIAINS